MNILKQSAFMIIFASVLGLPTVQADEVTTLPTIRIMAESELREEVGFVPFQEDKKVRQALEHQQYKVHTGIQNAEVNETTGTFNYQAKVLQPDISQYPAYLQEYILAVASGFQSSDPTNGLFKMLEPLKINPDNANAFREGTMKVSIDDIVRLQQQIRDGLNSPQNNFFTR
ncbi:hypothetical protein NGC85_15260 [Acinetobacter sp. Z1]|uniref:hypothetical protein n=1 Tax=Acinetobacter sp. Z1 TaxID=2953738 RepID=UPI0020C85976|nr:hypothetical protein [Acinetobacter sp. Z1]UTO19249.1 hypothetical protein NGC85_15260 [Acinetobacter sp. Z1]